MKKVFLVLSLLFLGFFISCDKSEGFEDPLNNIIIGTWEYGDTIVHAIIDFYDEDNMFVMEKQNSVLNKDGSKSIKESTVVGFYTVIDDKHINLSYFIDEEEDIRETTIEYKGYVGSLKSIRLYNLPLFSNQTILVNKL